MMRTRRLGARAFAAARMGILGSEGLLDRCREQFAYGHVDILRRYVSRPPTDFLAGRLPHDEWGYPIRESVGGPFKGPSGRELPIWTWNDAWREWHRSHGARRVFAIGAPWLYLLRVRKIPTLWEVQNPPERIADAVSPQPILYVPLHSWERETLDLSSRARGLAEILDPKQTVVLLGWGDYLSRRTRDAYGSMGFRVECNGYRGGAVAPSSSIGDREIFLDNLLDLFLRCERVVSEEVCTALIFASSLGLEVRVMPELQGLARSAESGWQSSMRTSTDFARHLNEVTARYDWMTDGQSLPSEHTIQIRQALGAEYLMEPDELSEVLTWRSLQES